jgi:hypothetical protein
MGLFNWKKSTDEEPDEIAKGFEEGLLTRWDIPWDQPDDVKDEHLRGLLAEREKE